MVDSLRLYTQGRQKMSGHTKGKIELGEIPTNLFIDGLRVARCDFDGDGTSQEAKENARRIRALWNACQRYSIEELEYGLIDKERDANLCWERTMMDAIGEDGPKSVADAIQKIKQENAALRAQVEVNKALAKAAEWFAEYVKLHEEKGDSQKAARNSIRAEACIAALAATGKEIQKTCSTCGWDVGPKKLHYIRGSRGDAYLYRYPQAGKVGKEAQDD